MRLTNVLYRGKRTYREKLEYLEKFFWRVGGSHMDVDRLRIPDRLARDPNNPTRNAEDMFTSTRYEKSLANEIEIGVSVDEAKRIERLRQKRLDSWLLHLDDPRYHPNAVQSLIYSDKRRFSKGLDQASLLTNTTVLIGQPLGVSKLTDQLCSLVAKTDSDVCESFSYNLRGHVERAILHAHVWHTDETKLPRRFRSYIPIWKHKTEYGIHPEQTTRFLFHNLFRILDVQFFQFFPELDLKNRSSGLPERWSTRDRLLETHYNFGGEQDGRRIAFAHQHDLVISGRARLHPFTSQPLDLIQSPDAALNSLGPMSPLIDLNSTQYYRQDSSDGWIGTKPRIYPYTHLITVNLSLPSVWSDFLEPESDIPRPDQRQAAGLMHCFASAIAQAYTFGLMTDTNAEEKLAEEPITIQAVVSDGVYFDFIAFQLNTLRIPVYDWRTAVGSSHGMRNLVWIDGGYRLFDKRIPTRSMLRNTCYTDLDLNVFTRLAANYAWGLLKATDGLKLSDYDQNVSNFQTEMSSNL